MDIEDSPEYKECKIENGKKYKKVQQGNGSWVWVEVVLETVANIAESVGDVILDFDIDID